MGHLFGGRAARGDTVNDPRRNTESSSLAELDNCAEAAIARFRASGCVDDVGVAISTYKQAIAFTPRTNIDELLDRLTELGDACFIRFHVLRKIVDIRQCVSALQAARSLSNRHSANLDGMLAQALTELGMCLSQRADRRMRDVDNSVKVLSQAVDLTPSTEVEELSGRMDALAIALRRRFEASGDTDDINRSIAAQRQACGMVDEYGEAHVARRAIMLYNLSRSLSARYRALGGQDDLLQAVELLRQIESIVPAPDPNRATYLLELGGNLNLLFEATLDANVIDDAVLFLHEAISLSLVGEEVNYSSILITLGEAYANRFAHLSGSSDDITAALTHIRRSLDLTTLHHLRRPLRIARLGAMLLLQFQHLGGMVCLQESVLRHREAIRLMQEDDPDLPQVLYGLGIALSERFELSADSADLDEAIDSSRRAVKLIPDRHPHLASFLHSLACILGARFSLLRSEGDLEEAVLTHQRVLEMTPSSAPNFALYQSKVAGSLLDRFQHNLDVKDLHMSIQLYECSLGQDNRNQGHRNCRLIADYANALRVRYIKHGLRADLDVMISSLHKICSNMDEFNPDATLCHYRLGDAFRMRFEVQGGMENIHTAVDHFRRAALAPGGNPSDRLVATRGWAIYAQILDPRGSLEAHAAAIDIVVLSAGLDRGMEDRHFILDRGKTWRIPSDAATAALENDKIELALEWLEQGRCLAWRQVLEMRLPMEDLRLKDRDLADEASRLLTQLEKIHVGKPLRTHPGIERRSPDTQKIADDRQLHRSMKLVQNWEDLLRRVREKEGFEYFLRPAPVSDTLQGLPRTGYTVIFNTDFNQCYAIVIPPGTTRRQPNLIQLPEFNLKVGATMLCRLDNLLRASGGRGNTADEGSEMQPGEGSNEQDKQRRGIVRFRPNQDADTITSVLRDLWRRVVEPLVIHLELKPSKNAAERARIWWCATGPLLFLPIHAAGAYKGKAESGAGEALADYAISSYTPTLASLADRFHEKPLPAPLKQDNAGLLIISHSDAPGQTRLPGVREEAAAILKTARQKLIDPVEVVHLENSCATVGNAMSELGSGRFGVIHFACHAFQDTRRPMRSGFHLEDGKLTLGDIVEQRLVSSSRQEAPRLAFLSACQTGAGALDLSEEVVHLTAGMLAAGYRGVIGTMWNILDAHAPEVAESFYERYLGAGGEDAAYALHCATEDLRRKLGDSDSAILAWAPFMHFGV